jgi:hypothetical protein
MTLTHDRPNLAPRSLRSGRTAPSTVRPSRRTPASKSQRMRRAITVLPGRLGLRVHASRQTHREIGRGAPHTAASCSSMPASVAMPLPTATSARSRAGRGISLPPAFECGAIVARSISCRSTPHPRLGPGTVESSIRQSRAPNSTTRRAGSTPRFSTRTKGPIGRRLLHRPCSFP